MASKTYTYERRLQLKHFFDDRGTGQTRRTWLEIQLALPEKTTKGYATASKNLPKVGHFIDVYLRESIGLYILWLTNRTMRLS
jgi:hypothetical protein